MGLSTDAYKPSINKDLRFFIPMRFINIYR